MNAETRIRAAAQELHDAIADGRETGLRVDWPGNVDGLAALAVSQVGPVVEQIAVVALPDQVVIEKPVAVPLASPATATVAADV